MIENKENKSTNKNLITILLVITSIILGIFIGANINRSHITQDVEINIPNNNTKDEHKININKATYEELKTIDGIGEVKAKKLIENRPYNNIHDLLKKNVIGEDLFNKLKGKLVV